MLAEENMDGEKNENCRTKHKTHFERTENGSWNFLFSMNIKEIKRAAFVTLTTFILSLKK
jgi:hypothetical protein